MFKIMKYAKEQWYMVLVIMALLLVQVFGELRLPTYTSNIVDVGITKMGVAYPIPEKMSEETWENLHMFMDPEKAEIVDAVYVQNDEGIYEADLDTVSEEDYEACKDAMMIPEMIIYMMTSDSEQAVGARAQFAAGMAGGMTAGAQQEGAQPDAAGAGDEMPETAAPAQSAPAEDVDILAMLKMMPEEQRAALLAMADEQIGEAMTAYPDYLLDNMGVQFVIEEYGRIGIDMDQHQMDYLLNTGAKMLAIAVLIMIVSIFVGLLASRVAAYVAKILRGRIYHKVMGFSNAEMNQFSTASLITRCTNDVQQVQMVIIMMFRFVIYAPLLGIGAVLKVMGTATSMVWIIIVAVIALLGLIMILLIVAMPKFKIMQSLVDRLNLVSREMLTGLSVIRAFGREKHEEARFEEASGNLYKTQLFTSRTMALMMPTMFFVLNGISVLIIWTGAHHIDMGTLQVGEMMAFINYTMQIIMAFLMIAAVSIMLPRASVAADRIDEVLMSETLITDEHSTELLEKKEGYEITFEHVSFKYPNAEDDVLKDITFTAKAGQTTAIIGGTGSGKSTLVQLIPRLYDATEGSVKIDGKDIRDLKLKDLREKIGFVPQKGILFSGTIASNIKYGNMDASDELMKEAAAIAQATEFIERKPEQYESSVAQGGNNVSGGQKQRLSIARAIAKQAGIYVFDDSFSALDFKTDAALRKALNEKVTGATVLIVAQRISTILHADNILVMDNGEIIGQGTHKELMATNEVYRQIAQSQLKATELEGTV